MKIVEVRYVGEYEEVEVRPWHDPDGGRCSVKRGKTLKTSPEHAEGLIAGGQWELARKRKPAAKRARRPSGNLARAKSPAPSAEPEPPQE